MGPPALMDPPPAPDPAPTRARDGVSVADVTAGTIVAVLIAVITDAVSSVHPLIPVAITPALTAFITVSVSRAIPGDGDPTQGSTVAPRSPLPRVGVRRHGLAAFVVTAALVFVAAVAALTLPQVLAGRSLDETTLAPTRIAVPDVQGERAADALAAIRKAGLEPAAENRDTTAPQGRVVETDPTAGTPVRKGSGVTVYVSTGKAPDKGDPEPPKVTVRDVAGMPLADALQQLEADGLKVSKQTELAPEAKLGTVVRTTPEAGAKVEKATGITVFVPDIAEVPSVDGKAQADAVQSLEDARFSVEPQTEPSSQEPGTVVRTEPAGGETTVKGSLVTMVLAAAIADVTVPSVAGMTQDEAKAKLTSDGFETQIEIESSSDVDVGDVIRTDPGAGTQHPSGTLVTVVVSSGA